MDAGGNFVFISGLICEPARARMLWNLLDGRAYTATELAVASDLSATSASNHLAKLLKADVVRVEMQGKHRYYTFASPDVAYAVESLANLAGRTATRKPDVSSGIKYCRTCYDHLAGLVAVRVAEGMEKSGILSPSDGGFSVSEKGWKWFGGFGIFEEELVKARRPITRQCLDWSERRPHLAGQLGARLLDKMLERKWFKRIDFSRELEVLPKGRKEISDLLGVSLF